MAQRHNHYEAAFEDYVRSRGWPYVPVDEKKKAIFSGARIKSFDFLVYRPGHKAWIVDIKGRKFPYTGKSGRRYWENWVTCGDLEGLRHWEGVFGDEFEPGLMFVYWLVGPPGREPTSDIHLFRNKCYAFLWIRASDYAAHARQRSPKWDTVSIPSKIFRRLARPIHDNQADAPDNQADAPDNAP